MTIRYGFSKIIVGDLEASAKFYEAVCGLSNRMEVSTTLGGRALTEYVYGSDNPESAAFVIMHYHSDTQAHLNEAVTGFYTDDIRAFVDRAVALDAKIVEDINERPELQVSLALLKDPEGHLLEVIQPMG